MWLSNLSWGSSLALSANKGIPGIGGKPLNSKKEGR